MYKYFSLFLCCMFYCLGAFAEDNFYDYDGNNEENYFEEIDFSQQVNYSNENSINEAECFRRIEELKKYYLMIGCSIENDNLKNLHEFASEKELKLYFAPASPNEGSLLSFGYYPYGENEKNAEVFLIIANKAKYGSKVNKVKYESYQGYIFSHESIEKQIINILENGMYFADSYEDNLWNKIEYFILDFDKKNIKGEIKSIVNKCFANCSTHNKYLLEEF